MDLPEVPNMGLVRDGTPCGDNLICVNQTCVSIFPHIDQGKCPSNHNNMECSGHGDRVIGSFIFMERTVNGAFFLDMLQLFAVPQLPCGMIFLPDGTSCNYAGILRDFLHHIFFGRWLGRGSLGLFWLPGNPDIMPLDLFIWGFAKNQGYNTSS
ncbi:hypothetical protein PR048_033066 [Dryococelus australis]|uniref:Uncharacterized protein n=1 Tax=Dryococelus australis TaxID=614101 RepID=A0ABQ9G3E7_9NEOP|nr:hypothetical protein PR048_033066 [Dryococelus australis]